MEKKRIMRPQQGYSPNKASQQIETTLEDRLYEACRAGDIETAKELLELRADPDAQNAGFDTPLHVAIEAGNIEVAKLLLDYGADPNKKNYRGYSPLFKAILGEHINLLGALLAHGADPDGDKDPRNGDTTLHKAARGGIIELAIVLLYFGANPTIRNYRGETPENIIKQKIEDAPTIEAKEEYRQLLDFMSQRNKQDSAQQEQKSSIVDQVLRHEVDPNTPDTNGSPALHIAAQKEDIESIKLLIEGGADPDQKDNYGYTALHAVIHKKNTEAAKALIEGGADPDMPNNSGNTPLHMAIILLNTRLVKELLELGANPTIQNHNGETPEDIIKKEAKKMLSIEAREEYRQLLPHVLSAKETYPERKRQRLEQQEQKLRHVSFDMDSVLQQQRQTSTTTRSMH